jgi:uncharacterized protein YndB with AHSA1/START domain
MPTESIEVSARFPVSPDRLYAAWLDSQEHTRFTGDTARVEPLVGGRFTAWSGYITGETLELHPDRRILQTWRTTEFPDGAEDSRIEVRLEPVEGGTRLTIVHTGIPDGQGHQVEDGWIDYYFEPMQRYFRRIAAMLAAPDAPVTRAALAAVKPRRAAAPRKAAAKTAKAATKKTAAKPARAAARPRVKAKAARARVKVARRKIAVGKRVARAASARPARRKAAVRKRTVARRIVRKVARRGGTRRRG